MLEETYKILFEKYFNYYFYNVYKNNEEESRNSANSIIKNISCMILLITFNLFVISLVNLVLGIKIRLNIMTVRLFFIAINVILYVVYTKWFSFKTIEWSKSISISSEIKRNPIILFSVLFILTIFLLLILIVVFFPNLIV